MTMKDEIEACLATSMALLLDPYLVEHGFARAKRSLKYKRKKEDSIQIIDILLQIHPKDNPNASAAVYPMMEVLVPKVDLMLDEMIGGDLGLLEGVTGGTSRQPIGFTSEKAHPGRWYVYQPDSIPEIVEDMRDFIGRWTVPFLDVYVTADDIVATDARDDGRLPRDRAQMMRVVAAALVGNRRDYARALMEKRLGAPGARRRYQRVFDFIERGA